MKLKLTDNQRIEDNRIVERIWNLDCITPPIPKNLEDIDGYGDGESKFKRTALPPFMLERRYKKDEKGNDLPIVDWTDLQKEWAMKEFQKIYYDGHWCFIRGHLTWLPPWVYFGLNYWFPASETATGHLEYRDRQRRILTYMWNVFQHQKELGVIYLKGRRDGATMWMHLMAFWFVSRASDQFVGLSASDLRLSEENFDEFLADPIKRLPDWLLPIYTLNKTDLTLRRKETGAGAVTTAEAGKGGRVRLRALTRRGFDGKRVNFLFPDESGKWTNVDVWSWWLKQQKTLMSKGKRIGFSVFPTTTEEIEEGGKEFKKLWDNSDLATKKDGKYPTTFSKLQQLFIPAYDGLPGWIGPYGESIIDYPDDEQWEYMQKENPRDSERIGAREFLEREAAQCLETGDESAYWELKRQNPFSPSEAFSSLNQNCPFDTTILQNLKMMADTPEVQQHVRRGYFYWLDVKTRTQVAWRDDRNGPIERTWEPQPETINKIKIVRGIKYPSNNKIGVFGVDPYNKANVKSKGSKMAVHAKLFFNYDYEKLNLTYRDKYKVDMPGYWPTPSVFLRYVYRSTDMTYDLDQLLMAAHYYSMPIAIENNTSENLKNHFIQRNMGGFLMSEAQILNLENPNNNEMETIGIFTGSEAGGNDVPRLGSSYHNDFLRGTGIYLREFTYDIWEQPKRYPFLESIQDNMNFNIADRTQYDSTMSQLIMSIAEFNMNDYGNPMLYVMQNKSRAKRFFPKGYIVRNYGRPISSLG